MSRISELEVAGEILDPNPVRVDVELERKIKDITDKYVFPYQRGDAKKALEDLIAHIRNNR